MTIKKIRMTALLCLMAIVGAASGAAHAEFEVKYTDLPTGVTMEYVDKGPKGAPAVIFIHGYPDSWRSYEQVLELWPDDMRAVAMSLRGFGGSSKPADGYSLKGQAADVLALMDHLDIGSAVIVGHSMGSLIASTFSSSYPDRTRAAVLIATMPTLMNTPDVQSLWDDAVSTLEDPLDPAFVREFQESTVARPVPVDFMDKIIAESLKAPAWVWRDMLGSFVHGNFEAAIVETKAPILFIWGSEDWMVTPDARNTLSAIAAKPEMLVVAGAGHSLHWEDPAFMAGVIADYARLSAQ